jgi:hypothetical protein
VSDFPTFPDVGPRWYVGLKLDGRKGVAVTVNKSAGRQPNEDLLDWIELLGIDIVYVFALPPPAGAELAAAVRGMFDGSGEKLATLFADRIEAVCYAATLPMGPTGEA